MSPIPYSSPSLRAFVLSVLVVSVGLIQSNSGYAQKQLDFNYTGRVQLWTVPSCVQKIKVEVWGAQGGGSYECDENGPSVLQDDGGLGGYANGILDVMDGQVLYLFVGGKGKPGANGSFEGGWNGGGDGGNYGGGGGGASDIRTILHDLDSRKIVGGGGGGGNSGHPDHGTGGAGGGLIGQTGISLSVFSPGGGGGSQVAGGLKGYLPSFDGMWAVGGGAGSGEDQFHIAGGGGGWYGGGSAYASGGGGGSSNVWYVSDSSSVAGIRSGNGMIRISLLETDQCVACEVQCKSNINISMPVSECYRVIRPEEILSKVNSECTTFGYDVSISYPYGTSTLNGNDVDRSHLGQTLVFRVSDGAGHNCWGNFRIEDKAAPVTACNGTQYISCYQMNRLLDTHTQAVDNCSSKSNVAITKVTFTDFGCDDPAYLGRVYRTIVASDTWGNSTFCSDTLYISKDSIEETQAPDLISLNCKVTCRTIADESIPDQPDYEDILFSSNASDPTYPSPELLMKLQKQDTLLGGKKCLPEYLHTVPYLFDSVLVYDEGEFIKIWQQIDQYPTHNTFCKIEVSYTDKMVPLCGDGSSFKIRREWLINDWCTGEEKTFVQYIEVIDHTPPLLFMPNGGVNPRDDRLYYRAFTEVHSCVATVNLQQLVVIDCSKEIKQTFTSSYTDPANASKVIVQSGNLPGRITLPAVQGVYGVRCHDIFVTLTDACYNKRDTMIQVCVIDETPPEVLAIEDTKVTVDPATCWSRIYARDLDNGSRDNCCDVLHFAIADMDSIVAARKYVYDAIIAQCGIGDYHATKEYYDFYIEDYVSSYIFKDYLDLTACKQYQIVLRVWEACGIPRFDPHIWPCSEHQWYMYNVGYPRSHYRADHNLNYGFSRNANYAKFKAPKDCNWRYPLIFCDPLLKDWFALAGLDDYETYYIGAGAKELCNFSFYWPRLGNMAGSFSGSGIAPGNTCSRMLWKDAMVMVTVEDKTPPVAQDPPDLFWYCDNVSTTESNKYEYAECKDHDYATDNAKDGTCIDSKGNPYNEIECVIENDNILTDAKDGLGKSFGWYGCNVYAVTHEDEHGTSIPCSSGKGSWAPVYCRSWLCLDANDQAGQVEASTAFYTPRLHSGPLDSIDAGAGRFWIWDNCAIDASSLTVKDESYVDKCSNGWLLRTWTAKDQCGNEVSVNQKIVTSHRSDFEVVFPADRLTYCDADGDLSPDVSGRPQISDDECEQVGVTYTDEIFDIGAAGGNPEQGLGIVPDACYKIIRTWKVIDWCKYDPNNHATDPDIIVDDRLVADTASRACVYRNIKDNGDGYMSYVQIIKVIDTIAPVITTRDTVFCIDDLTCTKSDINVLFQAVDNCTTSDQFQYRWELDVNPTSSDLTNKSYNKNSIYTRSGPGVKQLTLTQPIGVSLVHVIVSDRCGNEDTSTFVLTVKDCKRPTPYCYNGIVTVIMPSTGAITVWAKDLDAGSSDNCTLKQNLRFSFSEDSTEVNKVFTCDDVSGGISQAHFVNIYVWDAAGLYDHCQTYILLQDGSGNACLDGFRPISQPASLHQQDKSKPTELISGFPASQGNLAGFTLLQNRPNPFNVSTLIEFGLPQSSPYILTITDITGRVIKTLKGSGQKGFNQVKLDGASLRGSGVYYYSLSSNGQVAIKKMIITN
ncbi:MAG: T9SS type A sorting domain-containing protein [Saprospiraceae bacterium]|nr:T9SS type A sorting domain-containing protein [Saprospiraceae bacterium]